MKRVRWLLLLASLSLVVAACGGDAGGEVTTTTTAATTTSTTAAPGTTAATTSTTAAPTTTTGGEGNGDEPRTIEVVGLDEAFSTSTIEIGAGEVVTIVFNNKDTSGEPHNFHVRTPTNDWFTTIAEAPDIQEITFSIDAPGEYDYFCDTHPQTMTGKIIVSGAG